MSTQTNLFGFNEPSIQNDNTSPAVIKVNSKDKQTTTDKINKKIQKIDKLKAKFEKEKSKLEKIKKVYAKKVSPIEKELFTEKENFANKLFKHYTSKGYAKWQMELMEETLMEECDFLFNYDYHTPTLQNIYKTIQLNQAERMDPMEKEFMNDVGREVLSDFGFDVDDDDDFNFEDFLNNEEFSKQYQQQQHESQKAYDESLKKEKVINTNKQFQKLYKSLVKKVHPDLVTVQKEKEEREVLMKRLSETWEHRDYYQLLLLKAEIEKNNKTHAIEIDEDQSKSLLIQLDQEIQQLNSDIYMFKEADEEHHFYFKNFNHRNDNILNQKIYKYIEFLTLQKEQTVLEFENLKTKAATKRYLQEKRNEFENVDEDFFPFFFE
ncbi:hypothetical protein [Aquimarina agarilytica]|uniref:hypothetical protein n=1 Tax=Aquimarina agarilytica TaxID=1087449 RepID=UPI00028932E6|nr:hypothetical protein [Aquimarina agarilytica]